MTDASPEPKPTQKNTGNSRGSQRWLPLIGSFVIAVALVGFLRGIAERDAPSSATLLSADTVAESESSVAAAARYSDMHTAKFSPNAGWSTELTKLKYDRPSRLQNVARTPEMKLAAIIDRSANRAFDGAPPVIPHKVEQQSAKSCLACHEHGMKLGNRVATAVSHPHFTSCTQCHVESKTGGPFAVTDLPENSFAGIERSGPGSRAAAGAPPTIPHTTWLRENCMSCHGTIARPGLRTSHPWLSNCTQCHAPAAALDQTGQWTMASEAILK